MSYFEILQQQIATDCYAKNESNRDIQFLIMHHLQANSVEETIKSLELYGVSAHYLIDYDGVIYQIVEDNDIAFHAGVSYWDGFDGLNKNSIGIEFINSNPFENEFSPQQIQSGVNLASFLIDKYQIKNRYVLGHSDIAYNPDSGFLDRKQDPSHLFNWHIFAQNNIGLYPHLYFDNSAQNHTLFEIGDIDERIFDIKDKLHQFGYRVSELNNIYDEEMRLLSRVFNRHFNNNTALELHDNWLMSSNLVLNQLISMI